MGNQQIIILVLGTIIVAVALAVGITTFRAYHVQSVGDQVQETLLTIVAEARTYYEKPTALGGGGGSFLGYRMPGYLQNIPDMTYHANPSDQQIYFAGGSSVLRGSLGANLIHKQGKFFLQWLGTADFADRKQPQTEVP
jgi:hypothetical protein